MTVRILLSSSRAIGARVIEITTWSDWSHCELLDGDLLLGANWPRGVELTSRSYRLQHSRRWALIEVDADYQSAWAFARQQAHRPYDLRGALGLGLHRRWQDPDSWFCSELVAAALLAGGTQIARLDAWRVTPQTIWQSPLVRVIEQSTKGA